MSVSAGEVSGPGAGGDVESDDDGAVREDDDDDDREFGPEADFADGCSYDGEGSEDEEEHREVVRDEFFQLVGVHVSRYGRDGNQPILDGETWDVSGEVLAVGAGGTGREGRSVAVSGLLVAQTRIEVFVSHICLPGDRSCMATDWSSLRAAVIETFVLFASTCRALAGAMISLAWTASRFLRRLALELRSLAGGAYGSAASVLSGSVRAFLVGPLRVVLLGKRRDVSLLTSLLSPVLALVAAWWVASTIGYDALTTMVRGTWFGTAPSLLVFLAVGGLLALGTISAGVNSGLLPTAILVSAPIFGASVTRYGTTITHTWGSQVVSLPNAVGVALLFAVAFGVPLAVAGFLIGRTLDRVVHAYDDGAGPPSTVDTP